MITKIHGVYHGICDICDESTNPQSTWQDAKDEMQIHGWKRTHIMGEYNDICRECDDKNRDYHMTSKARY